MPPRILDQRRRAVETHRLVVEQRRIKGGRAVHLEPGRGVRDQREGNRMAFGKTVKRKRGEGLQDVFHGVVPHAVALQGVAEPGLHPVEPFLRPGEADGPAQLVGLRRAEAAQLHRQPQDLLLEQHHAQGALQDRPGPLVGIGDRLGPGAAPEEGMSSMWPMTM